MWDPDVYLAYADERGRPFVDLLARVRADAPRAVVDLGCGPGELTALLARRWPDARVTGIDASAAMIDRARALDVGVAFDVGDVRAWRPGPDVDVLVSNATLQWVGDAEDLLRDWAAALPGGAWIAVQVPGNFDAPSHRTLRALATSPAWRPSLDGVLRDGTPVLEPAGYADLFLAAGCEADVWETTYLHVLDASAPGHPVGRWMEGTALRPVRAALDDDAWSRFRAELDAALHEEYPVTSGRVVFPFRRIFAVARTAGTAAGRPAP